MSLILSSRQRNKAWESGFPSPVPLFRLTRDESGQRTSRKAARSFGSRCRWHCTRKRSDGETKVPATVHVVDDDASFRTAIERRLKKAGYAVATYPSAQQLLDQPPDENEPGCILLDV